MKQPFKRIISYAMAGLLSVGMLSQVNIASVDAVEYTDAQKDQLNAVQTQHIIPGTTKTQKQFGNSFLSVSGYAKASKYEIGDRSGYTQKDAQYAVVKTPAELFDALERAKSGQVKVIEIGADLDLGWFALTDEEREYEGIEVYSGSGYSALNTKGCSFTNPDLMKSGISTLGISDISGLTIFSTEGYSISHAEIKLQASCNDIIIRNLRFEGMWEWDDWQMGGYGGRGEHKRTGWSTFKINGADRVWIDHCDFGIAFDGCLDISGTQQGDGCEGISVTWCTFGKESMEPGSMVYNSIEYLESIYQESKVNPDVKSFTIYGILRDSGWTPEECMEYGAFHSKCHLTGDGDKDYDKNPLTRYTLAYNQYYNMQQRVPMVRQGSVHMYNCFIDYMYRHAITDKLSDKAKDTDKESPIYYKKVKDENGKEVKQYYTDADEAAGVPKFEATISEAISLAGGSTWALFRAMDARNGASVAADTCVYFGVNGPITGSEHHLDGSNLQTAHNFGYNHALIVNSSITKWDRTKQAPGETYTGSSWDNDGNNPFIESQNYWRDKKSIGNWTWMELTPEGESDKAEYDQYIQQKDKELPYGYYTVALDKVEQTVKTYGGSGVIKMDAAGWLKNYYSDSDEIKFMEAGKDAVAGIALDEAETIVYKPERLQLYATVSPATAAYEAIKWTSSDETIATVGQGGLVTPLKNGEVTIMAEVGGKSASCKVTVKTLPTKLSIMDIPSTAYVGDIYPLAVDVVSEETSDKTVDWKVSSTARLSIDNGVLEAVGTGSADLTATSKMAGKMIWNPALETKRTIKVNACKVPTTGVELDVTEASVSTEISGDSVTLQASVLPADSTNKKVRWESSDPTVAVVEDGVVTPVSTGEAIITVTTINGAKSTECKITVTDEKPVDKKGDVDNNGEVDSDDAVAVLRHFAGLDELTGAAFAAADVDGSGEVDSDDAVLILRYFAGLIDDEEWALIGKKEE